MNCSVVCSLALNVAQLTKLTTSVNNRQLHAASSECMFRAICEHTERDSQLPAGSQLIVLIDDN